MEPYSGEEKRESPTQRGNERDVLRGGKMERTTLGRRRVCFALEKVKVEHLGEGYKEGDEPVRLFNQAY